MESRGFHMLILLKCIAILVTTNSMMCDARSSWNMLKFASTHNPLMKEVVVTNDMEMDIYMPQLDSTNTQAYGPNSPFSQPPYVSVSPENSPSSPSSSPSPQNSPQPPRSSFHSPPNPPQYAHGPPPPPKQGPSPPKPTPTKSPPPGYEPPPPHKGPSYAVWCVAKPTVPDPIVQEAVDYACGSGADCKPIQPNGPCYQPDTLLSHASFAFNSYWQSKKLSGGTCDFGGTAMLVTVDPSFNGCRFELN